MKNKYELVHLGINTADSAEAEKTAQLLSLLFDLEVRPNQKAVFAGSYFECMRGPGAGTKGHIGIGVEDVSAAVADLKEKGFAFNEESAGFTPEGKLRLIYLADEIAGFAVHLVQK